MGTRISVARYRLVDPYRTDKRSARVTRSDLVTGADAARRRPSPSYKKWHYHDGRAPLPTMAPLPDEIVRAVVDFLAPDDGRAAHELQFGQRRYAEIEASPAAIGADDSDEEEEIAIETVQGWINDLKEHAGNMVGIHYHVNNKAVNVLGALTKVSVQFRRALARGLVATRARARAYMDAHYRALDEVERLQSRYHLRDPEPQC